MDRRLDSMTGFVLAGGESRRMGRPKAALLLGDETMLERQIRLLSAVCRSVAVIGASPNAGTLNVPAYADDLPGCGPLGGILTGLLRTRTEFNFFLGCDLPFLDTRFLFYLARMAWERRADVTVPESREHGIQPLSAVYRRRVARIIRGCLEQGQYQTSGFFSRVRCQLIPWREIARAGFPPRIFANMNTLEEYEAAKRIVNSKL